MPSGVISKNHASDERDGKADDEQRHDDGGERGRERHRRLQRERDLQHDPAADDIARRDADHLAPLQLGDEAPERGGERAQLHSKSSSPFARQRSGQPCFFQ